MRERERKRDRETSRDRDRQRERQTDKQTERQILEKNHPMLDIQFYIKYLWFDALLCFSHIYV